MSTMGKWTAGAYTLSDLLDHWKEVRGSNVEPPSPAALDWLFATLDTMVALRAAKEEQ